MRLNWTLRGDIIRQLSWLIFPCCYFLSFRPCRRERAFVFYLAAFSFSLFGTSPLSFPNLLHFLSLLERTCCCCCCCFYYCCYGGGSVLHTTAISASLFPLCDRRKSSRSSFCIPFLSFLSFQEPLSFTCCIVLFLFRVFFLPKYRKSDCLLPFIIIIIVVILLWSLPILRKSLEPILLVICFFLAQFLVVRGYKSVDKVETRELKCMCSRARGHCLQFQSNVELCCVTQFVPSSLWAWCLMMFKSS